MLALAQRLPPFKHPSVGADFPVWLFRRFRSHPRIFRTRSPFDTSVDISCPDLILV